MSGEDHSSNIRLFAQSPSAAAPDVQRLRYLTAQPMAGEDAGWESAFQRTPTPPWLREPDVAFRFVPIPSSRAVFLQMKTNTDAEDGERIGPFLAQARQSIEKLRPRNLILDMRFNRGGDYTKTGAFMSALSTMVPGGWPNLRDNGCDHVFGRDQQHRFC